MTAAAMAPEARVQRRRTRLLWLAPVEVAGVVVASRSHRGVHVVQNLVLPGSGLYENHAVIGGLFTLAAVVAVVGWVSWGVDWAVAAVWVGAVVVTAVAAPGGHTAPASLGPLHLTGAHEFPLVALVVTGLTWVRTVIGGAPGVDALRRARHRRRGGDGGPSLGPAAASQAAAIGALAHALDATAPHPADVRDDPRVVRRARRVAAWARWRSDPLALDMAGIRAALALGGRLDQREADALRADAARRAAGVPASEPGWVRPLDATLAALALHRLGEHDSVDRWVRHLQGPFGLRRGHRPAWSWAPLGISAGRAPLWEHTLVSGLGRAMGWVGGDDDWHALRRRLLGAAARGSTRAFDERAIAAARLWLAFVPDEQAARILQRPTVGHDRLAVAIDALAAAVAASPDALRSARAPAPCP